MVWFIGFLALMALTTYVFITYLSAASKARRHFLRFPATSIFALREGVPARVTGTIVAAKEPVYSPLSEHPAVRVHIEINVYEPGGESRDDYIHQYGTHAVLSDDRGGLARIDFRGAACRVRFVDEPLMDKPLDISHPTIAELFTEFDFAAQCRRREVIPMGRGAIIPNGAEISIVGVPHRGLDGEWELKPIPIHRHLIVRIDKTSSA